MKATGIVRRVDDLGRVVIPKEICRSLCIKEGDPVEIYLGEDNEIILEKYCPDKAVKLIENLDNFTLDFLDVSTIKGQQIYSQIKILKDMLKEFDE